MRSPKQKPWLTWLVAGVAAAACVGAWVSHRSSQLTEEHRREETRRVKEIARVARRMAFHNRDAAAVDRFLSESPEPLASLSIMLSNAAAQGDTKMARVLLKHGCNPDGDPPNSGPLISAIAAGRREMVRMLLSRDAHVDTPDPGGQTALLWAARWNQVTVARILIEAGADVNRQASVFDRFLVERTRKRPVDYQSGPVSAVSGGGMGGPQELPPKKKVSPLMLAAWFDEPEMVRMLLKYRPNLALKTDEGETALDLARKEGHREIVRILTRAARASR